MKILICSQMTPDGFTQATAKTVRAVFDYIQKAGITQPHIDLIAFADSITDKQKQQAFMGINQYFMLEHPAYQGGNAEQISQTLTQIIQTHAYEMVVAPAGTFWTNILPRTAGMLDVMMLSDVIEMVSRDVFKREIYAGSFIETVRNAQALKVMTIKSACFAPAFTHIRSGDSDLPLLAMDQIVPIIERTSLFMRQETIISERPVLTEAKIVVAGGRGLGSLENFALIEQLADCLGAAVGASRAAVDAGYASHDCQIGQTGKMIAADLYIAVGISGAAQHIAGLKNVKKIIAINKDADAPIFKYADYGIVGDLFQIIPEVIKSL